MIEAIRGGASKARAICDGCGREEIISCGYAPVGIHKTAPNKGHVASQLAARNWAVVKGKHRCPECEAARKAARKAAPAAPNPNTQEKAETMTQAIAPKVEHAAPPLRAPSPKQKREIIGLLELAYDDEAKRYKVGESDKKIAEVCGDGILWGWVAQVREELFGPDTRNQEVDAIRKDVAKLAEDIAAYQTLMRNIEDTINDIKATVFELVARMAALKARLDKVA